MSAINPKVIDVLHKYADTIYLTQTMEKKEGRFNRFLNLEDAFAACLAAQKGLNPDHPRTLSKVTLTL